MFDNPLGLAVEVCSCGAPVHSRGMCSTCYQREYRAKRKALGMKHGETLPKTTCKAEGCTNNTISKWGYCSTKHKAQADWAKEKATKEEWFAEQPEDNISDAVIRYALETNQDIKIFEFGKVQDKNDCLLWCGAKKGKYGQVGIRVRGKYQFSHPVLVHRLAYATVNELPPSQSGPKPDTLTIHHKCFETLCINPEHLEVRTQEENWELGGSEVEKDCEECGATFLTDKPRKQKYCDKECRQLGHKKNTLERYYAQKEVA